MNESILKAEVLSKVYKDVSVVDGIDLEISKGRIYGLIGKNGAGKTTFIRMVGGLTKPSSGQMLLYGEGNPNRWHLQRKKMSFIVEIPYIQPMFNAYENLKLQCLQKGIKNEARINEVLEIVSLEHTGRKKAGEFSLGMWQRLGIAIAMLSFPEFLILDEPLNGLDPEGMLDMRELLLRLNKEFNTTILISSHLLSELYQIATDYIIMNKGKVIEQITAETLDHRCSDYLQIGVNDVNNALNILRNDLHIQHIVAEGDGDIGIYDEGIDAGSISTALSCIGNDFKNKTIYYEVMSGHKSSEIIIGRIIPTLLFTLVILSLGFIGTYSVGLIWGGWGEILGSFKVILIRYLLLMWNSLPFVGFCILSIYGTKNIVSAIALDWGMLIFIQLPLLLQSIGYTNNALSSMWIHTNMRRIIGDSLTYSFCFSIMILSTVKFILIILLAIWIFEKSDLK